MLTTEQLAARKNFVMGSDAAVICGISPYKSRVKLWLEKTGRAEEEDISNANHIKYGNYMEDGVAAWFQDESGIELEPKHKRMIVHPDIPWMGGNLDFNIKGQNAILECKTALKDDGWGNNKNIIPPHYLMQVAHYCAVGQYDKAYIAVVFSMTREMRWYEYSRNLKLEEQIIEQERNFWVNHVLADVPPAASTEQDILEMHKEADASPIIATEDVEIVLAELTKINAELKMFEELKQTRRDKIAVFMQNHDTLLDTSGLLLATYKFTAPVRRFDTKGLEKNEPELYQKYLMTGERQRRMNLIERK